LVGVQWSGIGLAWAWVVAFPVVPLAAYLQARGPLQLTAQSMAGALVPGLVASMAMGAVVWLAAAPLEGLASWPRLPLLVALGGTCYLALLYTFSHDTLLALIGPVTLLAPSPSMQ